MDFLSLFRKFGLFPKSDEVLEMERVDERRATLRKQIEAEKAKGIKERAGLERMAEPIRKQLEEIDRENERNFGDLLLINDEKAMRGAGAELASDLTRDQLKEIDEEVRRPSFLEESIGIHQKNLLLTAISERVHAGYPFADGLVKLTGMYEPGSPESLVCQSLQSISAKGVPERDALCESLPRDLIDNETCSMIDSYRFADSLCKINTVLQSGALTDPQSRSALSTWYHQASNYVTSQQGIYFLGASQYLENYRMSRPFNELRLSHIRRLQEEAVSK